MSNRLSNYIIDELTENSVHFASTEMHEVFGHSDVFIQYERKWVSEENRFLGMTLHFEQVDTFKITEIYCEDADLKASDIDIESLIELLNNRLFKNWK